MARPKSKKGQPVKRKYVRNPKLVEPRPANEKDNELELLALLCSVLDNWDDQQKRRNLKFIMSKYYPYLTLSDQS